MNGSPSPSVAQVFSNKDPNPSLTTVDEPGCTVGGFLYDVFNYTGPSPINTPWMGLKRLIYPHRSNQIKSRYGMIDA